MRPTACLRFGFLALMLLGFMVVTARPSARAGEEPAGRVVFVSKGCAVCHEERAVLQAPHLSALRQDRSLFALAAAMWNHAPTMWANLPEAGVRWPRLAPRELADLAAYLNGASQADPPPNVSRGQVILYQKGCLNCHTVGLGGLKVAKDLGERISFGSDEAWIAALWNHAPTMFLLKAEKGLEYPSFDRQEMKDMVGFLRDAGRPR